MANTYGFATDIHIAVDAYGRITSVTTNTVAGVLGLTFNNPTGVMRLAQQMPNI